jgi:hypothetical protein
MNGLQVAIQLAALSWALPILYVALVLWAVVRVCGRIGRSGWSVTLLLVPLVNVLVAFLLASEALRGAGHSRKLAVLAIVPPIGAVMFWWLGFRRWPGDVEGQPRPLLLRVLVSLAAWLVGLGSLWLAATILLLFVDAFSNSR